MSQHLFTQNVVTQAETIAPSSPSAALQVCLALLTDTPLAFIINHILCMAGFCRLLALIMTLNVVQTFTLC